MKNRYGVEYSYVKVSDNKYRFEMAEDEMMYMRVGGREGQEKIDMNDLGMFDPPGGPYVDIGSIVEGKKVSDNAVQDVYIDIYDDLSAAVRLGAPVPELIKKMKSLGLSSKDIKIVLLAGNMKGDD